MDPVYLSGTDLRGMIYCKTGLVAVITHSFTSTGLAAATFSGYALDDAAWVLDSAGVFSSYVPSSAGAAKALRRYIVPSEGDIVPLVVLLFFLAQL